MINDTTNGAGSSPYDYGKPIKTYNEQFEQEIAKLVCDNCHKVNTDIGTTEYVVKDISALVINIIEFIQQSYDKKNIQLI